MNRTLATALISATLFAPHALADGKKGRHTIVDTAVAAGQFKTLTAALGAAGLVDTLKGDGPFTVFAPSDEAFAKLPKSAIRDLLRPENKHKLTSILTYHVVPGKVLAKDVVQLSRATTVNKQSVDIGVSNSGVRIDGANVIKTDIQCSNGVIHVIDSVLMPATASLVKTAQDAGTFRTLLAAGEAAGLAKTFMGDGPFTVFAPTDEAFAKIPQKTIQSLLQPKNRDKLISILKYHVVPGRVFASDAASARQANTLQKADVRFSIQDGRFRVNDAAVIANDIEATNGVIHVIDTVLMPPAPPKPRGAKYFGVGSERPDAALAYQLDLDRHATLVVTSVTKGSMAAKAGLKRYDVITSVGGRKATDANLKKAKAETDYGQPVRFVVMRGKHKVNLDIAVGEREH